MNGITDIFIRRPVLSASLSMVILLIGLRAWMGMKVREFPNLTTTIVTVTTSYPGASSKTVQSFITSRLEHAIAGAPAIDYMTASSAPGLSTIVVHMELNQNPDAALAQILSKVEQVRNQLPAESQAPVVNESNADASALIYLAYYSKVMSQQQINDYLVRVVQPKLQAIPGISEAQILPAGSDGTGNSYALRVWLNPTKMAAVGVTGADLVNALRDNDAVSAVGSTRGKDNQFTITANTSLHNVDDFSRLVVKDVGGTIIRLGDVARTELGSENYDQSVFFNGIPADFIGVEPTPTANALDVAKAVHLLNKRLQATLPPGLHAAVAYDASSYIQKSINDVTWTLVITLLVVMAVIFLFLGSLRTLFIPMVAIPLSIAGAGIMMLAFGFSINLLTLLAIVLAIGLVVDDAIIVVENIHRHLKAGQTAQRAALEGARELAVPVIIMTLTLIGVFLPIAFTGGLTGALFTEFAVTLMAAVLFSGIVALTLSPMLASRMLKHTSPRGFVHWLDYVFDRLANRYAKSLHLALEHRKMFLAMGAMIFICIPFLVLGARRELAPVEDQGEVLVAGTAQSTATLHYLDQFGNQVRKILASYPETAVVWQINGIDVTGSGAGDNALMAGANLKSWNARNRTQGQLLPSVQRKLNHIAGLQSAAFTYPPLPGTGRGLPIQLVVDSSAGYRSINQLGEQIIDQAMRSGKFAYLTKDLRYDSPQINLDIDRNVAASLGVTMSDINADLEPLLGGNYVNRFSLGGHSYQVIPQVSDDLRSSPESLMDYYLRTRSAGLVPLGTVVKLTRSVAPPFLPQFQQQNSATIEGVPAAGVTIGQALEALQGIAKRVLPRDYNIDFAGESREFIHESRSTAVTFALSVLLIFLLLAAQFESFTDSLVVMVSVPLAICGAVAFLYLGVATLNIYTEVGLITLIGLITKQGILIVQFANDLQEANGLGRREAIEVASRIRLRPILMTTAAMVLGVVPLLVATGAGAKSRFDIGLVVASGLSLGALFSLFMVPVMYTYLGRQRRALHVDETMARDPTSLDLPPSLENTHMRI